MKRILLTLSFAFLGLNFLSYAQTNDYLYAYALGTADGGVYIHYLDPETGIPAEGTDFISAPDGGLIAASPSPDGRWIVFWFGNAQKREIILYDLQNHLQELVTELPFADLSWFSEDELIQWSPDSQKFAFLATLSASRVSAVHVYRLDIKTIDSYGQENQFPVHFSWSPDSRLLAVSFSECGTEFCEAHIWVFDIRILEIYASTQIQITNSPACQIEWSPYSRYLLYQNSCEFPVAISFNEIFLWDLAADTITQLTQFTNDINSELQLTYAVHYELLWLDDETFLLSVNASQPDFASGLILEESFIAELRLYTLPSLDFELFGNVYMPEAMMNPVWSKYAYLTESISIIEGEYTVESASVQVALYSAGQFSGSPQHPAGCDFQWSGDGLYLAYTVWDMEAFASYCDERSQELIFLNDSAQTISEFDASTLTDLKLIGWVLR